MCCVKHILRFYILWVSYVNASPNWIPYNGLWYYISDANDTVNYTEAMRKCSDLDGRLAALPGWFYHKQIIATFTGSIQRWISSSPKVIFQYNNDHGFRVQGKGEVNRYGYICDWQCQSVGVYPQFNYRSIIVGVYALENSDELRQNYYRHSTSTDSHIEIFHTSDYNGYWCFNDDDDCDLVYASKSFWDFTPYNQAHEWKVYKTIMTINFFCHDCQTLQVTYTEENSTKALSDVLYKSEIPADIKYVSTSQRNWVQYNTSTNILCLFLEHGKFEYCDVYRITPTFLNEGTSTVNFHILGDTSTPKISCLPNPVSTQTTVTDVIAASDGQTQETAFLFNNTLSTTTVQNNRTDQTTSHISKKPTVLTTGHIALETTEAQLYSDKLIEDAGSSDKTTTYIAIACAVGGVIIIVIVVVAVVFGVRRMNKKQNPNNELNGSNNIATIEDNIYSINPTSNSMPMSGVSNVTPDLVSAGRNTFANPEYCDVMGHTPNENIYSDTENVDLTVEDVYINSGFIPQSSRAHVPVESLYAQVPQNVSSKNIAEHENTQHISNNDIEMEFCNNDINDNIGRNVALAEHLNSTPASSESDSDLELYHNNIYEGND